eukprot:1635203-Pleurochrysis_carterae.AAC.5
MHVCMSGGHGARDSRAPRATSPPTRAQAPGESAVAAGPLRTHPPAPRGPLAGEAVRPCPPATAPVKVPPSWGARVSARATHARAEARARARHSRPRDAC